MPICKRQCPFTADEGSKKRRFDSNDYDDFGMFDEDSQSCTRQMLCERWADESGKVVVKNGPWKVTLNPNGSWSANSDKTFYFVPSMETEVTVDVSFLLLPTTAFIACRIANNSFFLGEVLDYIIRRVYVVRHLGGGGQVVFHGQTRGESVVRESRRCWFTSSSRCCAEHHSAGVIDHSGACLRRWRCCDFALWD